MMSLHNVSIQIGNKTICRNLTLDIPPGTMWGFLGPNGSGKTTLLHALAGIQPVHGDIKLNHQPFKAIPRKKLAQVVGILLQEFNASFPQSVLEYCLGGRFPHLNYLKSATSIDKQIAFAALENMTLLHLQNQNIQTLSGGEKRRLAIATLLTQQPQYYLLDEPTNHLDIPHQIQVLRHFKLLTQQKNTTAIMALHDINLAQQFCDFIVLLFPNGEIRYGKTNALLTEALLTSLYQHQLKKVCAADTVYWVAN